MSDQLETVINNILSLTQSTEVTQIERVHKIWKYLDYLDNNLETIPPWGELPKYWITTAKESIQSNIFSLIYPHWITKDLIDKDQMFHTHLQQLSSQVTKEFLGLTIPDSRQELFDVAVEEFQLLDIHFKEPPRLLLYRIYACFNVLTVTLLDTKVTDCVVDILLSAIVLVIIKACPQHLNAICCWIDEWSSPLDSRSSELFYLYTHVNVAIHYINLIEVKPWRPTLPWISLSSWLPSMPAPPSWSPSWPSLPSSWSTRFPSWSH